MFVLKHGYRFGRLGRRGLDAWSGRIEPKIRSNGDHE